jgi:DNA-binding protein HU-beta
LPVTRAQKIETITKKTVELIISCVIMLSRKRLNTVIYNAGSSFLPDITNYEEETGMTKAEIVERIAAEAKVTKSAATKAFAAVVGAVKEALQKGDKVSVVGFGTFSVSERKARKGRNPQTGKEIKIAARKVPKFTAGKNLKESLNTVAKAKAKKGK